MKHIRPFVFGLIACGIAVAMATNLSAETASQGTSQGTVKVMRIKGSARYHTGNNSWQILKEGDVLKSGAVIQTARDSLVDLVLNNPNAVLPPDITTTPPVNGQSSQTSVSSVKQDVIRMWEDTILAIDKLTVTQTGVDRVTETQLDLQRGHILGTVKKLSAASVYEIKIPNGVAGIRGTIYDIWADGRLDVLGGPDSKVVIVITKPDGSQINQTVGMGSEFNPASGQQSIIPGFNPNDPGNPAPDSPYDNLLHGIPSWFFPVEWFYVPDHTIHFISETHRHHHGSGRG
jgi:hypothetical protein